MHDKVKSRSRRQIPAVSKLLDLLNATDLPRPLIVDCVRKQLAQEREGSNVASPAALVARIRTALAQLHRSRLQDVVNGTGIIIHTNLGRAPLAVEATKTLGQIGSAYSNLEYDLSAGERGHRGAYIDKALALLCGAESAMVVNNCAAALVLIAQHFIKTKPGVIISRGEIVQIGGGFRIGEILEASGAKLREVGATNKTTLRDYARAIDSNTAFILKVHRSNFFMDGFVDSPDAKEIGQLARKKRLPFVVDLGSGALESTGQFDSAEIEPTPANELKNGADLVCFSGDKLFGGPQAGIIAGKKRFVTALKCEPLFRALRCDKLGLAALQATVDLHLRGAQSEIPALALLRISKDELRSRAAAIIERLRGLPAQINVGRGAVKVGGGTLPRSTISSVAIDIVPNDCSVREFADRLRALTPPVVGYIANKSFKLDLRTIFPAQDDAVVDAIRTACTTTPSVDLSNA